MRAILMLVLLFGSGVASAEPVRETIDGPVRMKASEIRAYNAALDPSDPAYIVCQNTAPTGSLIARNSCRTRSEWNRMAANGNDNARALVTDAQTRQFSIRQEPEFPTNGRPN